MKTKLGITVGLFGAGIYLAGYFGGVLTSTLILAYVLLFEEDLKLKMMALKSTVLVFAFLVLTAVIGYVPGLISIVNRFVNIFGGSFSIAFIQNIISFVQEVIYYLKSVVFLILALTAFGGNDLGLGPIDKMVQKQFE